MAYILKFTVSELTIHITSMFGRIGVTASRDGAKTRTTCWFLDVWLTDSSRCLIAVNFKANVSRIIPKYGYFPNPAKSWLIVKEHVEPFAKQLFADLDINITTRGQKYLGAVLGGEQFVANFINKKIESWVTKVESMTSIAKYQPQAAEEAYCFIKDHSPKSILIDQRNRKSIRGRPIYHIEGNT